MLLVILTKGVTNMVSENQSSVINGYDTKNEEMSAEKLLLLETRSFEKGKKSSMLRFIKRNRKCMCPGTLCMSHIHVVFFFSRYVVGFHKFIKKT